MLKITIICVSLILLVSIIMYVVATIFENRKKKSIKELNEKLNKYLWK